MEWSHRRRPLLNQKYICIAIRTGRTVPAMAYGITSVSLAANGELKLLMHDPVTQSSFVSLVPSTPNLPTLIMVLTVPFRRKR